VGLVIADSVLAISRPLFLCVMLTAVGGMLFPVWLLIGLARAWQGPIAGASARRFSVVCFIILIRSPTQIDLAVAIQSAVPLVSAIVSVPFILPIGFGGFRTISFGRIKLQLVSAGSGVLYALIERTLLTLPAPFIQQFSGYAAVGYYSIADKFISA